MLKELFEEIKKPFMIRTNIVYNTESPENVTDMDIHTDDNPAIGFKDELDDNSFFTNRSQKKHTDLLKQKNIIQEYRKIANEPDVSAGIDDIINEASYTDQREPVMKLEIKEDNDKIRTKLQESFDHVINDVLNLDENIFSLMEKFYIDGQLNVQVQYKKNKIKEGVQHAKVLSPFFFWYNKDTEKYQHMNIITDKRNQIVKADKSDIEYDREEIIRIDSGIYDENIQLGFLNNVIKSVNQLNTLEDLLIPMRFGRSVSRRVFNVDVGEMAPSKAESYLQKVKNEFKYKKFYDVDTGKVSNTQHVGAITEDYWFANRDGGKGTTVDTLDETGNLGEIDDILHFRKKILTGMRIPASRAQGADEDGTFGPNNEDITQAELKFYLFISRFRKRFIPLVKGIFKREVLSTGILTADEYKEYEDNLEFYFTSENKFFIKMKQMEIMNQYDLFSAIKEDIGTDKAIYSYEYVFKYIFNLSEEEMQERFKEIEKEKQNKSLSHMYAKEDDGY